MNGKENFLGQLVKGAACVLQTKDFHEVDHPNLVLTSRVEDRPVPVKKPQRGSRKGVIR